jgi:osmoprotectant transport system substrate-binding protein
MRKQAVLISTIVLALSLIVIGVGCGGGASPPREVTVGNKNFTEQHIAGELMRQLLEDHGFTVNLASGHSTATLREGMEAGDIDICADYTGTGWMVLLAHEREPGRDNNEVYRLVKEEEEGNGFIWLDPMWNNNTYALASWPEFTEEHGLETLSDLASLYREKEGQIVTSIGEEFYERPDGLPALEAHYNFTVSRDEAYLKVTKPPVYCRESLEAHECDVAMVFGTDAAIDEYGWHLYVDDEAFFPPYDLTPYVRQEVLDEYPEIADILNELMGTFPGGGEDATPEIIAECQRVWQELNAKVDIHEMNAAEVAREYLVEHGLIK